MRHRGFLLSTLLLLSLSSMAEETYTANDIADEVKSYVIHTLESEPSFTKDDGLNVSVSNLDPRLKLSDCDNPLSKSIASSRPYGNNISVKVSCRGEKRWTIYVPAQIQQFASIAVVSRTLARGSILTAEDVSLSRMDLSSAGYGHIKDPLRAIGMELKRPLQAGEPLRVSHLKQPQLVKRGDRVLLEASTQSVSVVTVGHALNAGQLGDQIRVRNSKSDRVVDAQVIAPGRAKVAL